MQHVRCATSSNPSIIRDMKLARGYGGKCQSCKRTGRHRRQW
jgi:hypothetical protein